MIWYLLYPFRGTTEAPVLAPNHPLRSAFSRFGRYAANHVVVTLLISVAVAAALLYPIPFLYTNDFINGASNLPHHVWTDARPLDTSAAVEPDVIMRSIWVHGSYMKALDREVLLGALELQDELLGPTKDFNPRRAPPSDPQLLDQAYTADFGLGLDFGPLERDDFHVINGLTNKSWFFHSPLQYWSGDYERISNDRDIISTVNAKKTLPTSVNVTLRHSVVFSGKRFEERSLVAADALVITLIHLRDSPVGRRWQARAEELAVTMADKWTAYPSDGVSMPSQLYEFQFLPMSLQDSGLLALAYTLSFLYFLMSMTKLRAVKSKPGLMITVLCQILTSIGSSFTICAIFKVDLSRIPQASYPLVVLSMSMENMFRLINSVLMTPSEDNTSNRIGQAFGQTAPVALASLAQNLIILWGLSKVVSTGISAFCVFCAVAIVFDFFYLSTFFLSVLSIEVRRTELSDALEKSAAKQKLHHRSTSGIYPRTTWSEAMLQGRVSMSTRIAGMAVMVGFVLIAQWHFFDNEGVHMTLSRLLMPWRPQNNAWQRQRSSPLLEVHQARSPTSWLRLQDHETAREVIHVIKPHAHSYVARVFEPLVFVMKGSDRMPPEPERPLLPAVYDFVNNQWKPFLVFILFLVAAVRILTNYLLWDDNPDSGSENGDDAPLLSVKTLHRGHALDVALMSASSDGQLVTVGLDRLIRVWDLKLGLRSHLITTSNSTVDVPFPVLALAIDEASVWLAILCSSRLLMWNLAEQRWGPVIDADFGDAKLEAFFFGPVRVHDGSSPLIAVRHNGTMAEMWPHTGDTMDYQICKSPLISVMPITSTSSTSPRSLFTLSRRGCVHRVDHIAGGEWLSTEAPLPETSSQNPHSIHAIAPLSQVLVARSTSVDLYDAESHRLIHSFTTEPMQPRSLKFFHSKLRQTAKGRTGLGYFTIAYTASETGDCVAQTYLPTEEGGTICSCPNMIASGAMCCPWKETKCITRRVKDPGLWEVMPVGYVVGVRRTKPESHMNGSSDEPSARHRLSGLRRRMHGTTTNIASAQSDRWEVWCMSQPSQAPSTPASNVPAELDIEIRPMDDDLDLDDMQYSSNRSSPLRRHLMISTPGPAVRIGTCTLAVAFGDLVRVVNVGHTRFGGNGASGGLAMMLEGESGRDDGLAGYGSRRRKGHNGQRLASRGSYSRD